MRRVAIAVAAVSALALDAVPAIAHDHVFNTQISVTHAESTSNGHFHFEASGELSSPNEKCLPGRRVKLIYGLGSARRVKDVDISSPTGAWAVKATTASAPDAITLKVTKKRLSSGPAHRHVCGSDRNNLVGPG